jgi:hypothetical protein
MKNYKMKNSIFTGDNLPDHESGVRRMMADAEGSSYVSFKSLAEAKSHRDGFVILEGDDGGQIFVVCSASEVNCSEEVLRQLLLDLDAKTWDSPDAARIYYERRQVGEGVAGGMGGSVAGTEIWIHEEFRKLGLVGAIRDVIEGRRPRL